MTRGQTLKATALTVAFALFGISPAFAQTQTPAASAPDPNDGVPTVAQVITGTLSNFRAIPTKSNFMLLTTGAAGAAVTHPADADSSRSLAASDELHEQLRAGAFLGGTPFELGAAVATYGIGRAMGHGRVARLGADLIQAQLMAEVLAIGVKQVARRSRPEGSGYSFPSGHATVTFASADVLQRTFGWKAGVPAYAVASYVAASRIQNKRHYLSDVVFGAALGTVAGRTVRITRSHRVHVSPMVTPGGAGVVLALQPARRPHSTQHTVEVVR